MICRRVIVGLIIIASSIFLPAIHCVLAEQAPPILTLPANIIANPRQEIWIEVRVENVEGLLGFSIVIDLPNTTSDYPLEYVSGSSSVAGTLCSDWMTIENDASKKISDRLSQAVLINGAGYLPLAGSGTIVKFKLRVKENAADQIVPLKFKTTGSKTTQLNDGFIPITLQNGSIQITGSEITPTPTSLITPSPSPSPFISPTSTQSGSPSPSPTATSSVSPSPTPTSLFIPSPTVAGPSPTPTFPVEKVVIVTDDATYGNDLSGGRDYDQGNDRCLAIKWNFARAYVNPQTIIDIHIYVKRDNQDFDYLGRTASGSATVFEWRQGAPQIVPSFSGGPTFNHHYSFAVYFLTVSGFPFFYGPYENGGAVEFLQGNDPTPTPMMTPTALPTGTPMPTPTFPTGAALIVSDNLSSMTDLSNGSDYDDVNDRALVLRWNYDRAGLNPADLADTHIYVRVNQAGLYTYLGRTANGTSTYFEWRQGVSDLSPFFWNGPVFDRRYEFLIFFLTRSGTPLYYGPFENLGPVRFLQGIDPTPMPVGYTPIPSFTPTQTPTQRPMTGNEIFITGSVRELIGGQPIAGARITADEEIAYSGGTGEYQLILPSKGVYTILAQAAGFTDFSVTRMFAKSQTMNIRLLPAPPTPTPTATPNVRLSTVYGFVYNAVNYRVIPNAVIQIGSETTISNGSGYYYIDNISEGLYTIQVTAPNYRDYQIEFLIDGDLELNFPMIHP